MTKQEMEMIKDSSITNKPLSAKDLEPFLKDRTLLYGYTCDRKTFHVYLKDLEIHTIIYDVEYNNGKQRPTNITEICVSSNMDYIPNKRLYPEACDYTFCKLLKHANINLPFTFFNENRPKQDFYGFILTNKN